MKRNVSPPIDHESLLSAVRSAVNAAGGERISLRKFISSTGINRYVMGQHYSRWEQVLQAAGFNFDPPPKLIDENLLLADWATVARKLNHLPSRDEYRIEGKYNPVTIKRRFNGWHNVPTAFRAFASTHPEWADLLHLLPSQDCKPTQPPLGRPVTKWLTARERARRGKQTLYGPLLDFGPLHHAPVNEQGVVFLFGMLAEKLGFMVESLRTAFPDCEAKRKTADDRWERLRIEFEYESRNFREHGHDAEGCDLIICWAHNWPDCPLEVIALSDVVAKLQHL